MDTWLRVSHEDPFVPIQSYLTRTRLSMEVINLSVQFVESAGNIDGFLGDIDRQAQPRVITDVSRLGDICPFYLSDPNVVRVVGQALDLSGRYSNELAYTPSARHNIRTLIPYTSVPTRSHGIENESGSNRGKGLSSGLPPRAGRSMLNKNNPLKRGRDNSNNGEGSGGAGSAKGPNNRVHGVLICPYRKFEHDRRGKYGCGVLEFMDFGAQRYVYLNKIGAVMSRC